MLIDTNIFIELGKTQERSSECADLIDAIDQETLKETPYITKFTLNAIQALLCRRNPELIKEILLFIYFGKLKIVEMNCQDELMVLGTSKDFGLDFDDAVQYLAASRLHTAIVTYDKDFDSTGIETKTPKEVVSEALA